jgi:TolB-like protein/tetratricopeptide (TPR) repeat protein
MTALLAELRRRNVFRVAAAYLVGGWLVLQVTSLIADAAAMPAWADSLVLILLIAGFPVAIIVAWAFELTPEGMKKTDAGLGASEIKPIGPTDYVMIGLLVVVLAVTGFQLVGRGADTPDLVRPAETAEAESSGEEIAAAPMEAASSTIAVLAFEDLSPAGDQEHFSDGISEEILNVLVRVEELDVTSRTSAFRYKGSGRSIPEIASELRVRHVLEGSVRRAGDNIRITAQLIDAVDDTHLWSQTYDRPLTVENVFEVQDDIARAIVAALGDVMGLATTLTTSADAPTSDVEAYDLYLQARRSYRARGRMAEAEAMLEAALARDSEFADGWAQLAAVVEVGPYYTIGMEIRPDVVLANAERALDLDPANALAYAVLGVAHLSPPDEDYFYPIDYTDALERLEHARALDPDNTEALNWIGLAYSSVGHHDRALEVHEQCRRLDPLHTACFANTVTSYLNRGDQEEAMRQMREGLEQGMTGADGSWMLLLAGLGDRDLFLSYSSSRLFLRDFREHGALYDALRSARVDYPELREGLEAAWRINRPDLLTQTALMAALGDYSRGSEPAAVWSPALTHFRTTDTFKRQMRDSGILAFWQTNEFPPQCRPITPENGRDDFECD